MYGGGITCIYGIYLILMSLFTIITFDAYKKISYYDSQYGEYRQVEKDAGSFAFEIILDIVKALLAIKFGTLLIKVSKPTI